MARYHLPQHWPAKTVLALLLLIPVVLGDNIIAYRSMLWTHHFLNGEHSDLVDEYRMFYDFSAVLHQRHLFLDRFVQTDPSLETAPGVPKDRLDQLNGQVQDGWMWIQQRHRMHDERKLVESIDRLLLELVDAQMQALSARARGHVAEAHRIVIDGLAPAFGQTLARLGELLQRRRQMVDQSLDVAQRQVTWHLIQFASFTCVTVLLGGALGFLVFRQVRQLRQNETITDTIFDSIRSAVLVLDRRGTIIRANRVWWDDGDRLRLASDPVGTPSPDYFTHAAASGPGPTGVAGMRAVLEGRLATFSHEFTVSTHDGSASFVMDVTPLGPDRMGLVVIQRDVTARKRADQALRDLGMLHETILECLPVALFYKDTDGNYLGCNQVFADLVGREKNEIIGRTAGDILDPETATEIAENDRRVLATGRRQVYEHRFTGLAGPARDVCSHKSVYSQVGDPAAGIVGVIVDVTDQKALIRTLIESKQRLQLAINGTNDGLWDWNLESGDLYLSPRYKAILGYGDWDMANELSAVRQKIHPDDLPLVENLIGSYQSGSLAHHEVEFRMHHRDGSWRWILARGEAYRDSGGVIVRVAGTHSDITDRKLAEERNRSLAQRLTLATRAGGIGIWDYDATHDRLLWNDEMLTIYGLSRDQFCGTFAAWRERVHPDDLARAVAVFEARLADGGDLKVEFRIIRPDGAERSVVAFAISQSDPSGAPVRMIGTNLDVTDSRTIQAKLEAARQQAVQANEAKTRFLAAMSHELRTPLANIRGVAELLVGGGHGCVVRHWADKILEQCDHEIALVNDLLDQSRLETGTLNLDRHPFICRETVAAVVASMMPRAVEKGLMLRLQRSQTDTGPILGDETRVRQILINLIVNAVKFTDHGEVIVDLEEETLASGMTVSRIGVTDTGIGIDADKLEEIFDEFVQGFEVGNQPRDGTGLGLAISRRLARCMGGDITVQSTLGVGSRFTFEFTAAPAPPSESKPRQGPVQATTAAESLGTLLLVEDNYLSREIAEAHLTSVGWRVHTAKDGLEAVQRVGTGGFDAVLMDIQMPRLDGLAATREIRFRYPQMATMPIVGLSANAFAQDREAALAAGMNAFLVKPVNAERLLDTLAAFRALPAPKDAGSAVPSAESLFDAERLDELESLLPPSRLHALFSRLLDELDRIMGRLEEAVNAEQWSLAVTLAHSVKGSADNYGLSAVADGALAVEQTCAAEQTDPAAELLHRLQLLIRDTASATRRRFGDVANSDEQPNV